MDWHSRFLQQAGWTQDLRAYLFDRAGLTRARRVLEVGCGTGAVLSSIATPAILHGLDLEPARLAEAHMHVPDAQLVCGTALGMPYLRGDFDITFCHFLLLWVRDPLTVLLEMKRVTRPGGSVLALAEPDYDARLDEPEPLAVLGRWQAESLRRQGADTGLGGRLADLFRRAGIQPVETGILDTDSMRMPSVEERDIEWAVLAADLEGMVTEQEMRRMRILDEQAWERGERVLHVPTHFAWGRV